MMKFARLSAFTALSGAGWCIDFAIFNYLVASGHAYFNANLISASVAVTFVLITARRWVFQNHTGSLPIVVVKYVVWNIVAIAAASLLIKLIASALGMLDWKMVIETIVAITGHLAGRQALIANAAKILATPFTMYSNFVAMGYIIERRLSFV